MVDRKRAGVGTGDIGLRVPDWGASAVASTAVYINGR